MLNKMFIIEIPLLLSLINLAFCYRIERQTELEPNNANNTTTSILTTNSKEEISGLFDNDDNYQSWREYPDRLFPRFHTVTDQTKPTWTILTKSKIVASTDYTPIYSSSAQLTPVLSSSDLISPSSKLQSPLFTPTASNYNNDEISSSHLLPQSSVGVLTSYPIQSSFNADDLSTSDSFFTHTPFIIDSSSFSISTSFLPQSTPYMPLSSDLNTGHSNQFSSIDRSEDIESSISLTETNPQFSNSIHPSSTIDSSSDLIESTVHFNQTTTDSPNTDQQYRHKTVVLLKPLPEDMKNTSFEFENRLKKVFQLAFSRLHNKTENDLAVEVHNLDWSKYETNRTLTLMYSVKLNGKYLDNKAILELLNKLNDKEMADLLNANKIISKAEPFVQDDTATSTVKPDINLGELLTKNLWGPYSPIFLGLLIVLMLICCFYLGMLVCWCKHKSNKAQFDHNIKRDLSHLSPSSLHSSDTLNTENFIRWRSKPDSKQNLNKRTKSLFKDDLKSSSLSKLGKRKEIGSSPSNEFEYISFSSDTTNSSLQRDGSFNKVTNTVRHHPYNPNQDYNRNLNYKRDLNKDYQRDFQQDYQDYQTQVIQKSNQLNQPNSIKLLISRGVQNNLLTDDYKQFSNNSKKLPLEMPFNSSYYGNNVSVLNLSKEKLIPLNQYTSDSSTTTSTTTNNTINKDSKYDSLNSKHNLNNKLDQNSRPQSRSESRSSPKRLIKKEIIEEFETVTTTTFKPNSRQSNPSSNLEATNVAQLNEQTKSIINAIRDELKKFNTPVAGVPVHQSTHVQRLKRN